MEKCAGNPIVAWQADGDVQSFTSLCEQTDTISQELDPNYTFLFGDYVNFY